MSLVCAWCAKVLRSGDRSAPVSHGICGRCMALVESRVVDRWSRPASALRRRPPEPAEARPLPGFGPSDGIALPLAFQGF